MDETFAEKRKLLFALQHREISLQSWLLDAQREKDTEKIATIENLLVHLCANIASKEEELKGMAPR